METRRLELFVTLVDAESFRTAAEQLFITQPALSQQIIRLESEVGMQLIDRSTRPFSVTAAGREFYLRCQQILEHVHGLEDLMMRTKSGRLGRVRVGMASSLMYGHLPSAIKAFRDEHTSVDVSISYTITVEIIDQLESGRLDLAVLLTAPDLPKLETVQLYSEPYVLAVPDDHRLATAEVVRIEELRDEQLITIPRHAAPENHDALVVACMRAGFSPRGPIASGSYLDLIGMVSAGSGLSFVPRSVTNLTMPNVVYRPLDKPGVDAVISLCWYPDRGDPAGGRLAEHLRAAYAAPPDPRRPWMPAYQNTIPAREENADETGPMPDAVHG
jgi:LysR family transcriptional regulator, benzoate and cis,cis-muconate-responsive activator of ben and cat genes